MSAASHSLPRTPRVPAPVPGVERAFARVVPSEPGESTTAPVPAPAQELVRAQPAAHVFAPTPRPTASALAPATIAVSGDEQPAVRVHIGRLEVRANLQAAPPPDPRRREQAVPEGPSLGEYLRGRSNAR